MKTAPIVPARIDFDAPGAPRARDFDDVYHPREGALEQARGVFLAGNGLPERWRGRARFTVVEVGFGLGNNFLATWAAWREDPQRCERLHFVSLEKHPPTRADLQRAHAGSPLHALARELIEGWPPAMPGMHAYDFDGSRVQLLLGLGDALALARELVAQFDACYLDGFAPARNAATWSPELMRALARQAVPGANVATWSAARAVRDGLKAAGFAVHAAPGPGRKRDITLGRYEPRFVPPRPPARMLVNAAPTHALVVGGGLAGAASARALARQGVSCTVFDSQPAPATQASGNPAGLLHGTVGALDTPYTRLYRAASRRAARWLREHPGCGAPSGLLRLHGTHDLTTMRSWLTAQGLPSEYVQALDATGASAWSGCALAQPAWHFAEGGWADPVALVRATLAGTNAHWHGGVAIDRIEATQTGWCLIDRDGAVRGEAPLVVLANAGDALRLASLPPAWAQAARGQVSWLPDAALPLALPVASGSYAIALPTGGVLFGATNQRSDDDPAVRAADHEANLAGLQRLFGVDWTAQASQLQGRVAWRSVTRDRLPLVGAVPDLDAPRSARRDAPRLVPRRGGLFMLAALGSRGLTSAALCGELIAAMAVGAPWPLEADLADAIDPARLALR
jgi:tRNA 5-methylaminomethyl-2-thiouridine biosynthesis bifunctional protein